MVYADGTMSRPMLVLQTDLSHFMNDVRFRTQYESNLRQILVYNTINVVQLNSV